MAGSEWKIGETAANALRYELDLGSGIVDLRDVMRKLGLVFVARDFGADGGDGRYVKTKDYAAVVINTSVQHRGRMRFTIAHEIGHHRMHADDDSVVFIDEKIFGGGEKEPHEVEADAFAAYFLAPTKTVKADLEGVKEITFDTVIDLMGRYGLSFQATVYRLRNSQVINKKQADALIADGEGRIMAAVEARGLYDDEAKLFVGASIPDELRESALKLYGHGLIDESRLAEMLRVTVDEARAVVEHRGITAPDPLEFDESDLSDLLDDEDAQDS